MEGKDNILEELRLVSGFVATISRVTPYRLPDGYFDGLADQVLDRIRIGGTAAGSESDDAGIPNFLGSGPSVPAYSVPEGYFEGFAEKLMSRIKAGQEGGKPDQSPLEELTLLSPLLSRIDKKMPFEVPQGYFDELSGTVTANIGLSSGHTGAEDLSPLLAGLKDIQVYQAPNGYFESFPDRVLAKVKEQASEKPALPGKQPGVAKVVSISRSRSWWKYSAAAAVAGLILTGGWLWTHTSIGTGAGGIDITKSLPAVSDQEIESYLDTQNVPLADAVANSTASMDISDNDIKNMFGDIPDADLMQYMDEHVAIKEPATN